MNLINNVKKLFFIKMHLMCASLKSNKLIYGMYSSIPLLVPPNPRLVKGVKRNESTFREQTMWCKAAVKDVCVCGKRVCGFSSYRTLFGKYLI